MARELCGECGWHGGGHNEGCSVGAIEREEREARQRARQDKAERRREASESRREEAAARRQQRGDAGMVRRRTPSESGHHRTPQPSGRSSLGDGVVAVSVVAVVIALMIAMVVGSGRRSSSVDRSDRSQDEVRVVSRQPVNRVGYLRSERDILLWSLPGAASARATVVTRLPSGVTTECVVVERADLDHGSTYYLVEVNGLHGWVGKTNLALSEDAAYEQMYEEALRRERDALGVVPPAPAPAFSHGGVIWVDAYTKADGTHVRGHWRSR